jgi:hypothetical protein
MTDISIGKPNDAGRDFGSTDCSSALSQCTRNGISKACDECGYLTPVRMKDGKRHWIRCFMCQNDGPQAGTMDEAIRLWENCNG